MHKNIFRKVETYFIILAFLYLNFLYCGENSVKKGDYSVAIILGPGGKDDKSYNALIWSGVSLAGQELGIEIRDWTVNSEKEGLKVLDECVKKGYDMVVVGPRFLTQYIETIACKNKDVDFLVFDGKVECKNVVSCIFDGYSGGFLVGVTSAMASGGKPLGFIAPDQSDYIMVLYKGFCDGAQSIYKDIRIEYSAFNDVSMVGNERAGSEIAKNLFNKDVSVIFAPTGLSSIGVFKEARRHSLLAVGNDANQNYIEKGYILTSLVRNIDLITYQMVYDSYNKSLKGGVFYYGISGGWIDISIDEMNKDFLTDDIINKINEVKEHLKGRV
ncbi:MAG: BMP family lipoprotein [bacterium]